jgi:hypothetical protein
LEAFIKNVTNYVQDLKLLKKDSHQGFQAVPAKKTIELKNSGVQETITKSTAKKLKRSENKLAELD